MIKSVYYLVMINNFIPAHYSATFANAPEKVCIINDEYQILLANSSFRSFINSFQNDNEMDFTGYNCFDLLRNYMQEDEFVIANIRSRLEQAKAEPDKCLTLEFPFYTLKHCYWLMMVACRQTDHESGNAFTVIKFYDVTEHHERRKYENKRDDNNIVRQIIGESMHTWRQPLNTISLFVQDIKEQFDDNTLTKYYMNFSSRQITSEIDRLSKSIDEMAGFYTNDTLEDTINISESMFATIEKVNSVLSSSNTKVSLDCHALGSLPNEVFSNITNNFKIRCGTGTKQCFHGCNKGNVVIYGDRILFNYIIRMMLTLDKDESPAKEKNLFFRLSIENNLFIIAVKYDHNPNKSETLAFLKSLFDQHFQGICYTSESDNELSIELNFQNYKTKSPL